jgi:hypothetical protein
LRPQSDCAARALGPADVAGSARMPEDDVDCRDYLRGEALFPWQNFGMVS